MTAIERAVAYIEAVPAPGTGERNDALNRLAYALLERFPELSELDHENLCVEWASRCSPPIEPKEARRTIRSARGGARRKGAVGTKASSGDPSASKNGSGRVTYRYRGPTINPPTETPRKANTEGKSYDVADSVELPNPIPDGTRRLIQTAFQPGEGVRIAIGGGDDGRPKDQGVVLSREEWLKKLDGAGGDPNKFLKSSEGWGLYVALNPTAGPSDADVTAYRHALLEFDTISLPEQWGLIQMSGIPCTAVVSSGNKSLHAWVRVDAANRTEFDKRVATLFAHFQKYSPDEANRNPGRLGRLAGCERGTARQELLAVGLGAESWVTWATQQEVEGIGKPITPDDLERYDPDKEGNCLIGSRFICSGFGTLLIGQSGIGKSSLNVQMAICWAVGRDAFGIKPVRPLRSLIIQAENDLGDLAEMYGGVRDGLGLEPLTPEFDLLRKNLVFHRDTTHTGWAFCKVVQRLIELHRPDIVWLDPILSFVGDDISEQRVVGMFFRNWLNPILDATGVALIAVHHTGKPPSEKDARKHWSGSDWSYLGLGSSDLTNWSRACMVLVACEQGYELKLTKRGNRAGLVFPDGSCRQFVTMRHAQGRIFWEEASEYEPKEENAKEAKKTEPEIIAYGNVSTFLTGCLDSGESLRGICERLVNWRASIDARAALGSKEDISPSTARAAIGLMVKNDKLTKLNGKYLKWTAPNA